MFDVVPTLQDIVNRECRIFCCAVDEMNSRGRNDCGKARANYVLVKLATKSNWNQFKALVGQANVVCLEVVVDTCRGTTTNVASRDKVRFVVESGTQESSILQLGLCERQHEFGLAIANDDCPQRYV